MEQKEMQERGCGGCLGPGIAVLRLSQEGLGWLFAAACMGSVVSRSLFAGQRQGSPWSSLAGGPECRWCLCQVPSAAV